MSQPEVRYITSSELALFKFCKRSWWFSQWRRLTPQQPEVAGPAPIGNHVHHALHVHYDPSTPVQGDRAVRDAVARDRTRLEELGVEGEQMAEASKDHELVVLMIDGYLEWLEESGADADLEVIAPETKVEVPFFLAPDGREYRLLAKLDLRMRRLSDGARVFLDHKTVGNLTDLPKTAYMNEQMLHYALISRINDPDNWVTGAIFNMLRKVKRTARANPPFYGRHSITFNDTYLRSYWERAYNTVQDIARIESQLLPLEEDRIKQSLTAYPSPGRDCTWRCDFFTVCPMYDDGGDPEGLLPMIYQTTDPLARYITQEAEA